ncbi:MAG: hypothetical protein JXX29_09520 [Deltaproteobacteria bacterium]|nr:hypothetical protein [Deltaproteobacteria bacterium]MBN2671903.1 hypothetical protein [Deltaproteobacteria bacterium]
MNCIQNRQIVTGTECSVIVRLFCVLCIVGMCACSGRDSARDHSVPADTTHKAAPNSVTTANASSVEPLAGNKDSDEISPPAAATGEDTLSQSLSLNVREEPYEVFVDVVSAESDAVKVFWRRREKRISIQWDAKQELASQVHTLGEMMVFLLENEGNEVLRGKFALTIDWFNYPVYAERLARYAASDPEWQQNALSGKRGEPATHRLHEYIVHTTNAQQLAAELYQIVAPLNATLQLEFVEKCSAVRPGEKNEIGVGLHERGIRSSKRIPIGCLWASFGIVPN